MKHATHLFATIVFATTTFVGCAMDNSEDTDDDLTTASTEQDLSSNEHAAYDYFVARGLTKKQSAGIVGNLIQESTVRPNAVEYGGGPGRGIAQWSVGGRWDRSHDDNVVWYAALHHESRWALNTQLAFTWYELHSVGGYGLGALRKATTVKAATIAFERDFEMCGTCDQTKRYDYALDVYHAYSGSARIEDADEEDANEALPTDADLNDAE